VEAEQVSKVVVMSEQNINTSLQKD
jgi:hypothetical protein